ncbi:hypothetical protein V1525DRAFT_447154 [Lipomyces kononenkoae]|uniref:Uncharacterized protein n=1 Tax=Lipomyces kononenkoae TaxID=34357 RepID=A0ACC3SUW8_LIPKO
MTPNSPTGSTAPTPTPTIAAPSSPHEPASQSTPSATSTRRASGQIVSELGDTNRRDSMELDQMVPRKRVAIEVTEPVEHRRTSVGDPAFTTPADAVQPRSQKQPASEAEAISIAGFGADDASLRADADDCPVTYVGETVQDSGPLTTIERLVLSMSNVGNDEEPLSMEACIFEARRILQADEPREWLIALNEHLHKFNSLDEPHRDDLWASGSALFTQLPQIVSDFWNRTQPLSSRFWNDGGEQLIISFFKQFNQVAIYTMRKDLARIRAGSGTTDALLSPPYAHALIRVFSLSRNGLLSVLETQREEVLSFAFVPSHFVSEHGIEAIVELCTEVTKPNVRINAGLLTAIVPHVEVVVTISWTLYQHSQTQDIGGSTDEDSSHSSESSADSNSDTTDNNVTTKFPLRQLCSCFALMESSLGRIVNLPDAPDRTIICAIVDKLSVVFYVLIQISECTILSTHPATHPIVKLAESVPVDELRKFGHIIRKLYWWIKLFQSPRPEYKLYGIKKLTQDLNALYNDAHPEHSHHIMTSFSAVMTSTGFSQYLVSSEAHNVYIMQFAPTIYAILTVFNVISEKDLNCLWNEMISGNSVALFNSICVVLIHLTHFMTIEWLHWLTDKLLGMPMIGLEPIILKLVDSIRSSYQALCQQQPNGGPTDVLPMNPYFILLQLIRRVSNVSIEEEQSMKVKPVEMLDNLIQNLCGLMTLGPSVAARLSLLESSVQSLKVFGPDSLKDFVYIKAAFHSMDDANLDQVRAILDRDAYHGIVVQNVKEWASHGKQHPQSRELYQLNAITRQDALTDILKIAPGCISAEWQLDQLWNALGVNAFNNQHVLDNLWLKLASLADSVRSECPFIEHCFGKIKELPAEQLSTHCLKFVTSQLEYLFRRTEANEWFCENNNYFIPGFDTLWHFYLNALDEESRPACCNVILSSFTESTNLKGLPQNVIDKCHRSLVRHCIKAISAAGNAVSVEPSASISFKRSVQFLDTFLDTYHLHGISTIDRPAQTAALPQCVITGKPVSIKLQWHGYKFSSAVESLSLGDENSTFDLYSQISSIVSGTSFRMFVMGSEIGSKDFRKTLKDAGFRDVTAVMVVRRPQTIEEEETPAEVGRTETVQPIVRQNGVVDSVETHNLSESLLNSLRPADREIMDSFDSIYALLQLPDDYASWSWHFVRKLSPAPQLLDIFLNPEQVTASWNEYFPLQQPFRALYSDQVLQYVLSLYRQNKLDQRWIQGCYEFIIQPLLKLAVNPALALSSSTDIRNIVRCTFLNRAVILLREDISSPLPPGSFPLEDDIDEFVSSLADLADGTSRDLSERVLDVLLISSIRDKRIWKAVERSDRWSKVFKMCLLYTQDESLRSYYNAAISDYVKSLLGQQGRTTDNLALLYFWRIVESILPQANDQIGNQSSTLFMLAEFLLKSLLSQSVFEIDENNLLMKWYRPLREHLPIESLFDQKPDPVIKGYARLMICTIECRRHESHQPDLSQISVTTFLNLLLPYIQDRDAGFEDSDIGTALTESIGCVAADTRVSLCKLVLLLVDSGRDLSEVVTHLLKLFPKDGVLHDTWNTDRMRWLRGESGFVGLQNLANTCYVNSFVNQLYMNEEFRSYIFGLSQSDTTQSNTRPALLENMARLFAYLRFGWQKMLDTRQFIQSIVDFENKPIDVSVQMDVDEFYNLLLDRIDGQISAVAWKAEIRNCYGGSLLTQIKSKECIHVSERTEPFSAIQCDIKGKSNLTESLKSYVEGETMEGDNKYWCSQCSMHVDAEKRICLKDVPNHLIFHLKRFDFDLQTMQRSKINDRFEFPMEIDIEPFTFSHFSQGPDLHGSESHGDKFRLVGILVHSGTAESGHYYSYILNNSATNDKYRWIEFNDAEVSPFDPNMVANTCFGGTTSDGPGDMVEKPFSAYMLFYDRISPRRKSKEDPNNTIMTDRAERTKLYSCPDSLHAQICRENELLAMKWAIFGTEHLQFVLACYQRLSQPKTDADVDLSNLQRKCDNYHLLLFETFYQIVSRIKEAKEVDQYISIMQRSFTSQVRHCVAFLSWLASSDAVLRGLVIRCPNAQVRHGVSRLVRLCLMTIREHAPEVYGCLKIWLQCLLNPDIDQGCNLVYRFFCALGDIIPNISIMSRAWDEYYGLMADIAGIGPEECAFYIYSGYLQKALVSFYDDRHLGPKPGPAWLEVRLNEQRKPSYTGILRFLSQMLHRVDLDQEYSESILDRCPADLSDEEAVNTVPLTIGEIELLSRGAKKNCLMFLYRQVESDCPLDQLMEFIELFKRLDRRQTTRLIFNTVSLGFEADNAENVRPFLLCMLRLSSVFQLTQRDCDQLADRTFRNVESTCDISGEAFADFISRAIVEPDIPETMKKSILSQIHVWAPSLLVHWNKYVRDVIENNIGSILFGKILALDEQLAAVERALAAETEGGTLPGPETTDVEEGTDSPPPSAHAVAPPLPQRSYSGHGVHLADKASVSAAADEYDRTKQRRTIFLQITMRLVSSIFALVERKYRNPKVRLNTGELNFDNLSEVLRVCARVLDDEDMTVQIEELRQDLETMHVRSEQVNSAVDWTSEGEGDSDLDEQYLMELEDTVGMG